MMLILKTSLQAFLIAFPRSHLVIVRSESKQIEANILRGGVLDKFDIQISSQIKMNVSHGRTATDVSSSAKGLCTGCKYSLTRYCWWIRELKGFTFGSNILNLLAISVDRHEAFFNSLRYASNMTRKRVAYILTAVQGIPVFVTDARNIWQHIQ